jgi:hypothetical protein
MKKLTLSAIVALLCGADPALATTTNTRIPNNGTKSVCTTGVESAPSGVGTYSAPVGMDLTGVRFFIVRVCAKEGSTITTGASFDVYFYEPYDKLWAQWSSSSLSTGGKTGGRCYELQGDSIGRAIPVFRAGGRVAVVPNGVVTDQGAVDEGLADYLTIELMPSDANGNPR